jgi:tRNA1(Val) A37 N6-methylase TrmN6
MNEAGTRAGGLSDDAFLGGRIRLLQPEKGVRAGIDAVFLAAAIPASPGDKVLEAGIGSGAAALCLCARIEDLQVTGVEIQPEAARLARRNIARNGLDENITVLEADICAPAQTLFEAGILPDSYAHVFANPPYYQPGAGRPSPLPGKAIAHAHERGDLPGWMRFLIRSLKPGGALTLVHRPESLGQILTALEGRAGNIRIAPLFPRPGAPAHRILVQATKASRAPLKLLPGLVLQDQTGAYCAAANAVLRKGAAYPL